MAVTVFDTVKNQWFVKHSNGDMERCANKATALQLAKRANMLENAQRIEAALLDNQSAIIEGWE